MVKVGLMACAQLPSEDLVMGLAFSPNSRRFYDLRGGVVNVWESDNVTRFSDMRETQPLTAVSTFSEGRVTAFEAVTALGVSPDDSSSCAGYQDGGVLLFPDGRGPGVELACF
jgi:WD40 repeat protein